MKIAVLTIALNEEEYIGACIKQFKDFDIDHLVLLSTINWHGDEIVPDQTENICRALKTKVIKGYWKSETEQRNYGLAYLRDYDYVLIVDADELYLKKDIQTIIDQLGVIGAFRVKKIVTFYKDTEHILDPPDKHHPLIALDPKRYIFFDNREIRNIHDKSPEYFLQPVDIILYHFSFAKTDRKVFEKINSFAHKQDIIKRWGSTKNYFETVYKGENQQNIRPYGEEVSHLVEYDCPKEIKDLIFS